MIKEVDMYCAKLTPPPEARKAGVNGGAIFAFFRRSFPIQEEAITGFLDVQGWVEIPGTRQQLVLSPTQTETILRKSWAEMLGELESHGFAMRIAHHSEDDSEVFDVQRFFQ